MKRSWIIYIFFIIIGLNIGYADFPERSIHYYDHYNGIFKGDLYKLKVLSNSHIPKVINAVIMENRSNTMILAKLYKIIYQINESRKLGVLRNNKYPQKIIFLVMGSTQNVIILQNEIFLLFSYLNISKAEILKYFRSKKIDSIYITYKWMQDIGEFVSYKKYLGDEWQHGIFTSQTAENHPIDLYGKHLSYLYKIPIIYSPSESNHRGNYGGNLEATPDGVVFFGTAMKSEQQQYIRELGNRTNSVELDSKWLIVKHVDEYISTIPSQHKCKYPKQYKGTRANYSIVMADPLLGLEVIHYYSGFRKYFYYFERKKDRSDGLNISHFKKAIRQVLKDKTTGSFTLDDFDYHKLEKCKTSKELGFYCELIAENLYVKRVIEVNAKALADKTPCINDKEGMIRLPQLFYSTLKEERVVPDVKVSPNMIVEKNGKKVRIPTYVVKRKRYSSLLPNSVNLVALRDALIISNPFFDGFKNKIIEVLKKRILPSKRSMNYDRKRIFFIDDKYVHHKKLGGIHCATNVIREPEYIIYQQ